MRKYYKIKGQTFYLDTEIDVKMIPITVSHVSTITNALNSILSILKLTNGNAESSHIIEDFIKLLEKCPSTKIEPEEYTKLTTLWEQL